MYKVTFNDGTTFLGGEPQLSLWNNMPDKPIARIEYSMAGHSIILEGYEAYNHIVERARPINKRGIETISKVILMTKKGDSVTCLIFDFLKNHGCYYTRTRKFGYEYNNKPTTGWKKGIKNGKPKSKII